MGCKNAPSIFQRNMSKLLREVDFVSCYFDDIIIHSKTAEEHVHYVRSVMRRLQEGNMETTDLSHGYWIQDESCHDDKRGGSPNSWKTTFRQR